MARVMIVDDEPTILMILQKLLSRDGHEVMTAADGLAALERLGQAPAPDLVLLDLFMPNVSGRVVVEAMRSAPALTAIPVILVTGAVPRPEDYPPDGTYQGVITKPFDLLDVLALVRDSLPATGAEGSPVGGAA